MIESHNDLWRLTRQLETMANWLDEVRDKVDRARLCFELFGLEPEAQEELELEVAKFKRAVAALCGDPQALRDRRAA